MERFDSLRLIEIIQKTYALALQVQDGSIEEGLAEELSGECAELLARLDNDGGSFANILED